MHNQEEQKKERFMPLFSAVPVRDMCSYSVAVADADVV
jgi:hypothetical protein